LFFVVKRENYSKKGDNGIGLQMIKIQETNLDLVDFYWYQVTELMEPKLILTAKWTNTLLLGSISAASVLVKVKLWDSIIYIKRGKGCLNWWMADLDLLFRLSMMSLSMKLVILCKWDGIIDFGSRIVEH
jgi:hypothetical protein